LNFHQVIAVAAPDVGCIPETCYYSAVTFRVFIFSSCIHGNGSVLRNFLYVSDVANAFDVILHHGSPGMTYNIGSDFEISIFELAKFLVRKVFTHSYSFST
jgi:dTDP-D-glucose 4,6-dehydratase